MRITSSPARPIQVIERPAQHTAQGKPPVDKFAKIDAMYQEVTAPRVDMSRLIVDPRPDRTHPLLKAEVNAARVQANVEQMAGGQARRVRPTERRGRTEPDTIPERTPSAPPGIVGAMDAKVDQAMRSRRARAKADVNKAQEKTSPRAPKWAEKTEPSIQMQRRGPPSTAALHAMMRAGLVVAHGYRGREAAELQTLLQRRGHQVQVTGIFDVDTERAVRGVQRQHGLVSTGIVDAKTVAALEGRFPSA